MAKRHLVLMENERVFPQAIDHSRQFALRMDLEVFLLMVIEMKLPHRAALGSARSAMVGLEKRVGKLLSDLSSEFLAQGITVSAASRIGDPRSELLKFLAARPPFQEIIWASDEVLPQHGSGGGKHWIIETAGSLECPLYTVSSKTHD